MDIPSDCVKRVHCGVRQLILIPVQARQVAHLASSANVHQRANDYGFRDC